jgi:PleD family two-component response regulator
MAAARLTPLDAESPTQESGLKPELTVGPRLAKATILIVDDEPNNRFALSQVLADLEENIVEAVSGEDALRYLLREECAVILLDANMPGLDGYATAELIRRRDRSRHIPIIFVSAVDKDDRHVSRAYAIGAFDYVFKPVDPIMLRARKWLCWWSCTRRTRRCCARPNSSVSCRRKTCGCARKSSKQSGGCGRSKCARR